MPAAAVIPAPIAYIKVVAVKKLVVEFWMMVVGQSSTVLSARFFFLGTVFGQRSGVYLEEIRVFKAGLCLNTLAWNNRIGLWFYFVGFKNQSND